MTATVKLEMATTSTVPRLPTVTTIASGSQTTAHWTRRLLIVSHCCQMSDFSRGPGLRFIRLASAFYTAIAVLYTTNHLLSPLWALARLGMTSYDAGVVVAHPDVTDAGRTSQEILLWPVSSSFTQAERATGIIDGVPTSEKLFLSKAFSQSMQPLKVIPYYYRASGTFEQEDITITTLVTFNRFKVFSELVKHYQGLLQSSCCLLSSLHVKVRFLQLSTLNPVQPTNFWMLCMTCIY